MDFMCAVCGSGGCNTGGQFLCDWTEMKNDYNDVVEEKRDDDGQSNCADIGYLFCFKENPLKNTKGYQTPFELQIRQ